MYYVLRLALSVILFLSSPPPEQNIFIFFSIYLLKKLKQSSCSVSFTLDFVDYIT